MVWNDTSDEVGVGVVEGGHQLVELLLVVLSDGPEHALPRPGAERRLTGRSHTHTHNLCVSCQGEREARTITQ